MKAGNEQVSGMKAGNEHVVTHVRSEQGHAGVLHRTGAGDPYLRTPGPGFGVADPSGFINNTMIALYAARNGYSSNPNATLNQYCDGTAPALLG